MDNRQKLLEAYKALFGGPLGTMVLADLASTAFADRTTLVPGDPLATAANEGSRRLYLHILTRVRQASQPAHATKEIE